MKRFKFYFLVTALVACAVIALCAMPVMAAEEETQSATGEEYAVETMTEAVTEKVEEATTAEAETETTAPEPAVTDTEVVNQEIQIRASAPRVQNPTPDQVYQINVRCISGSASSFWMGIDLPWFVQVHNVYLSDPLMCATNSTFHYNVEDTRLFVAYSSADNFTKSTLFTIDYSIIDINTSTSHPLFMFEWQFVDNEMNEVHPMTQDLGMLNVTFEDLNVVMGDANRDGMVSLEDVMTILRIKVKGGNFSAYAREASDIDKNGVIDMIDCQYIQNFLVGKLPSLENVNGGNNNENDACAHDKKYEVYREEPTCQNAGRVDYRCDSCGMSFSEELAPTGKHEYDEMGNCIFCGKAQSDATCTHEKKYVVGRVDPTCCTSGNIDYMCDSCGLSFSERLPATDKHEYVDGKCVHCGAPDGSMGDENVETPVEVVATYSDEEISIDFYSDGTFRGTAIYADINADAVLDMSDMVECVGTYETNDEAYEVYLYSDLFKEIYGGPLTLHGDESGKLYR